MAHFRSGFKIIGDLTLRQSVGRIRSFSEDRKPGSWQPEDQWAVRHPCSTCPDPCDPPKKPKPSRSWLSICKDPEEPIPCDIRHNNCPPPKSKDEPWYAFITKKKPAPPKIPLDSCRMELQRRAELPHDEETCEDMGELRWEDEPMESPKEKKIVCKEKEPAPVIRLSCPPPKELDLMLWCGRPSLSVYRIANQCQSNRMPYDEFKPRKSWKPPPYSLPSKLEAPIHQPFCSNVGRAPLAEFKKVEIPKPVYTRYKSVELEDENFLMSMTDAKCEPDDSGISSPLEPPPPKPKKEKSPPPQPKTVQCPEKPVLVAASCKPVKLKCAPKFKFRPKLTKMVERRVYRNPCANQCVNKSSKGNGNEEENANKSNNDMYDKSNNEPNNDSLNSTPSSSQNQPKVITSCTSDEPQTYQRNIPVRKPPTWMLVLSKPGTDDSPLLPNKSRYPKEPDWKEETDGLKFYDGEDGDIKPKPPPDPFKQPAAKPPAKSAPSPEPKPNIVAPEEEEKNYVLMPAKYNIRNLRPKEDEEKKDLSEATFQEFIDAKTADLKKCSKSFPPKKENILYDLVRNCPLPPIDPSKPEPPPRKPPVPECPQPARYFPRKYYSTFCRSRSPQFPGNFIRMKSNDSSGKCKPRDLVPKPKECKPPEKGPTCDELRLPHCPKARIPPHCNLKKAMPPCKKKLAPKPSYSECLKGPLPCPKPSECNAWEKRNIFSQNKQPPPKCRKFSSWAPEGFVQGNQNQSELMFKPKNLTAPGAFTTVSNQEEIAPQKNNAQKKVYTRKELMLAFMQPADDLDSYYTSEKLVKPRKQKFWKKLKTARRDKEKDESGSGVYEKKIISLLLQDHHSRSDARVETLRFGQRHSQVHGFSPRSIIGYVTNLISGVFRGISGSHSSSATLIAKNPSLPHSYVETVDVDRIMKLTKPFRHETQSKLRYCTIDPLDGHQLRTKLPLPIKKLWGKQWNKSLVVLPKLEKARSSMWKLESLSPTIPFNPSKERKNGGLKLLAAAEGEIEANKKKIRLFARKSDEYVNYGSDTLTGRPFLLNRIPNSRKNKLRYYSTTGYGRHEKNVKFKKSEVNSGKIKESATNCFVKEMLNEKSRGENLTYLEDEKIESPFFPGKWMYADENVTKTRPIIQRKTRQCFEDIAYYPEFRKSIRKAAENLLKADIKYNIDKYVKRKGMRDILCKLREEMNRNSRKFADNDSRGECVRLREFSSETNIDDSKNQLDSLTGRRTEKAKKRMRMLRKSLSATSLYLLKKNLNLKDENHYCRRMSNPVKIDDTFPYAPISFNRKEVESFAASFARRRAISSQNVLLARRYGKASDQNLTNDS